MSANSASSSIAAQDLVKELCERAGVKWNRTNRIELEPGSATFKVFAEGDDGHVRVTDGEAVMETINVRIDF